MGSLAFSTATFSKDLDQEPGWIAAFDRGLLRSQHSEQTARRSGGCSRPSVAALCATSVLDGLHSVPASVSKPCTVRFYSDQYSVLSSAVRRPVKVLACVDRLVIKQDGVTVDEHQRSFGRGDTVYEPWHYGPVLARKPAVLGNSAPLPNGSCQL